MEGRYSTSAVSGDGRANAEVAKTKKTLFCADFQSGILVNGQVHFFSSKISSVDVVESQS